MNENQSSKRPSDAAVSVAVRFAVQPFLTELRLAIAQQGKSPSESAEKEICLKSRSVFFAFYDWVVLHEEINEEVEAELVDLFSHAVGVMKIAKFRDAVSGRADELRAICDRVRNGQDVASLESFTA